MCNSGDHWRSNSSRASARLLSLASAYRNVARARLPFQRCPSYSGRVFSADEHYMRFSPEFATTNYVAMGATAPGGADPRAQDMHDRLAAWLTTATHRRDHDHTQGVQG